MALPLNNPFRVDKLGTSKLEEFSSDVVTQTGRAAAPSRSVFLERLGALEEGQTGRRSRAVGRNVTDVAQRFSGAIQGAGPRNDVSAALNRARGIFKIAGATNRDFDQNLLRERIGAVKHGIGLRGRGNDLIGRGASIRDQVSNVNRNVNLDVKGAKQNFAGGIAGIAIGGFTGGRTQTTPRAPNTELTGFSG